MFAKQDFHPSNLPILDFVNGMWNNAKYDIERIPPTLESDHLSEAVFSLILATEMLEMIKGLDWKEPFTVKQLENLVGELLRELITQKSDDLIEKPKKVALLMQIDFFLTIAEALNLNSDILTFVREI